MTTDDTPTKKPLLESMLEVGTEAVETIAKDGSEKEFNLTFVGMPQAFPSNPLILAQPTWKSDLDRQIKLAQLRAIFRQEEIVAYMVAMEGWALLGDDTRTYHGDPVRENPRRRNVLMVAATDGTSTRKRIYDIERNAKGYITSIKENEQVRAMEAAHPDARSEGVLMSLLQ